MTNPQMFPQPMMMPMPMMQQPPNQRQMPVVVQAAFRYLEHVHEVEDTEYVGVPGTDTQPGSVEAMVGRELTEDEERAKLRALEVLQTYFSGDLAPEEANPDRPLQLLINTDVAAKMLHEEMMKKAKIQGQPNPMPDWAGGVDPDETT